MTANEETAAINLLQNADKPIAVSVSTRDVQALFACGTRPDQYNQLLLAKLKDAGGPVEGVLRLRLAHGQLFKLKDSVLQEQSEFTYLWLSDEYVAAVGSSSGGTA